MPLASHRTAPAAAPPESYLTTSQGLRISDNHNSLKSGVRGPTLLEDFILREKITHFDHERIPERVVHARGSAAHGYFQPYRSLASVTQAAFLQDPQQKTPVFVRFSTVAGGAGSADTVRDVRGFAVKFYTQQGNYDLVGNNIPVFFIQDAMKFPDLIHALKPEPRHGMPQAASAHDTFWDFASLMPEATHMLMWLMSDRALPRSLRMMQGFGVHTFRFINAAGDVHFVKFHWKPKLGMHGLAWDEAQKIAGKDPDFHRRDLWSAIAQGHFPEWELGVQMVPAGQEQSLGIELLDPTKLIPEELVPVEPIGRMVLDRNPGNFFAETEQVAFHPGHLVPGIDFSNDPLLQGRLFSYTDTQLSRLGGPNFHQLPINRAVCPVHNFQRDGMHCQAPQAERVAYEPHTLGPAATEMRVDGDALGFQTQPDTGDDAPGGKQRGRSPSFHDHFSQATLFWNSQSPAEKEHIVAAFRFELSKVQTPEVRQRMVDNLACVDARLARKVASDIGVGAPDAQAAAGRAGFRVPDAAMPALALTESAALSMAVRGAAPVATRTVAVLVHDGMDALALRPVLQQLEKAGLACGTVGLRLGSVATMGKRKFMVEHSFATMPSVLFDAVLVAGGADCAQALCALGDARHYVQEAYKHGKPICAVDEGVALLAGLGIAPGQAAADVALAHPGVVVGSARGEDGTALALAFMQAIAQHRHWGREDAGGVAA
ncbi:catalase [Ramlibacter sp. H39-3-26]|uniref:catalase n=1 Tax=Curvibacter soli TaxID=3031331 RepID=UPI0023DCAA7B|nr:catalase [Ramlibacter sp. H39-3-26]MDF1486133.1 catalase [Ramlibacter sp. H39-3-26]